MTHENRKIPRIVIIVILLSLAAISAYWAIMEHFIFFFMTIVMITMLFLVRFKKLELRNDKVIFREWSILPFLNVHKTWSLSDISGVESFDGYFDKQFFITDIFLNTGGYRGNTRPARLTLIFDKGESYTITKFGSNMNFQRISKKLKTIANIK